MGHFKKAILIASVTLCFNLSAFSQGITLKNSNVTVKEAMEQLKKSSGYSFVFSSVDVNTKKHVSVSLEDAVIEEAVQQILQGQNGLSYEIQGKKIIIKKVQPGTATPVKKIKATGKVVDGTGEPVIGATVKEYGTPNGAITDIDGNFSLNVAENASLEVSYIGYQSQRVKAEDGKMLAVTLQEDTEMLDEVVVVGYGTVKKANVVGSIAKINSDVIQDRPVNRVEHHPGCPSVVE